MATDEIRLVYESAENMIKAFQQGVEQLQDTMQEMQSIANTLEQGALLGEGGRAFVDAIRSQMAPSLSKLTDKFNELAGDVQAAITFMQQSDQEAAGKF
ncbi:MAG: WXG100 family type VII secretion target [Herpetosiphon sp.]|nr:WXG100 family type VII secretion target [Herpetosiphon sp.]